MNQLIGTWLLNSGFLEIFDS